MELNSATHVTTGDLIGLHRQAAKIDLSCARAARARLAGNHASPFRGRGMDYQESRGYQPGDDIRSMDWRVTARTGKPHTKLYQEERERPVVVFLDLNPGMFFGTRAMLKSVAATRAAALIGWAAVDHGDRIGAMIFNSSPCEVQPRGGRHGVMRLVRKLVEHSNPREALGQGPHGGALNRALARLNRVSRPGSLVFLLSDFYGVDDDTAGHLLRLRQHCDVAAIQVVDPLELAAPAPARYGVSDGVDTGVLDLRSAAARRAYGEYFSRHHETVSDLMRSRNIPLLRLSTNDDIAARLRQYFARSVTGMTTRGLAA